MTGSEESEQADPKKGESGVPDEEPSRDTSGSPEEREGPEATPQQPALRRQQYAVGVGAAIIAGFALTISSLQHFPSLPQSVPLLAGFVGAGLVYWIVQHSLYPTDEELSASE
jgi:hypothetical protein